MVSVIVPAHRGGPELERCLAALQRCAPDEVLVVTDAPEVEARAEHYGFRALSRTHRGPAAARNRGAQEARGDILVFIDSDVEIRPTTLGQLEAALLPGVDAVFGSYDDNPLYRNVCSLYANLRHHYVHQTSPRETGTFWTGCGAIRRQVFLEFGGFSTAYEEPSIEDIDLGMRLHAAGRRVLLCPEIQVTHCKRWTLGGLLIADIFRRALPWTRRLLELQQVPAVLNLGWASRASALAAWLAVLGLAIQPRLGLACLLGLGALNAPLIKLFVRKGGLAKGLGCCALHVLYFLYSSATFVAVLAARQLPASPTSVARSAPD